MVDGLQRVLAEADVYFELVRAGALPREFGDALDPSVRAAFERQWQLARIVDDT